MEEFILPPNVRFNEDTLYVKKLQQIMAKNGSYCPCRIRKIEENKCPCKEFREQIRDDSFQGYCHCKLYYKEK